MNTPEFTLYENYPSPTCLAVEIALHESEVPFKRHEFDPQKPKTKVFLQKSLFGRVPVLVEHKPSGDFIISEAPAILLYLAERFEDAPLSLDDLGTKSEVLAWMCLFDSEVGQCIVRVSEMPTEALQEIDPLLERYLDTLNKYLTQRAFLVGAYSVADVLATPFLEMVSNLASVSLKQFPFVHSWHERLRSRPSYQAVLGAKRGMNKTHV